MKKIWSDEDLTGIQKLLEDDRPLYMFVDDKGKIIGCEWFESHSQALNYARSLNLPTVNIFMMVGCAENSNENFDIYE